jgi:hypothetical protein
VARRCDPLPPCGDGTLSHAANVALLDLTGDGSVNLSDSIYAMNFLFSGGPKPASCADVTCPCILALGCPLVVAGDCPP